jgi:hypothetical protein
MITSENLTMTHSRILPPFGAPVDTLYCNFCMEHWFFFFFYLEAASQEQERHKLTGGLVFLRSFRERISGVACTKCSFRLAPLLFLCRSLFLLFPHRLEFTVTNSDRSAGRENGQENGKWKMENENGRKESDKKVLWSFWRWLDLDSKCKEIQ